MAITSKPQAPMMSQSTVDGGTVPSTAASGEKYAARSCNATTTNTAIQMKGFLKSPSNADRVRERQLNV
jgi:hypothetical protein